MECRIQTVVTYTRGYINKQEGLIATKVGGPVTRACHMGSRPADGGCIQGTIGSALEPEQLWWAPEVGFATVQAPEALVE